MTTVKGDPLDIRNLRASDLNDNWEHGTLGDGAPSNNKAAGSRTVKNREASLTAQCLICTGPAAAHQHYGAVCCYSCRAFFRRGITRNYACVRGDNLCQVNSITRTNCKRCRYARCLAVGMKPELVDATLKRKQEEKRRQELLDIQHEMGIQTALDTSQAVTGMMQLQQGGVSAVEQGQVPSAQHSIQAQHVLQAVQGLQTPLPRHLLQPHQSVLGTEKADDSLLYQALEGRKKVLLELRNGEDLQENKKSTSIQNRANPLAPEAHHMEVDAFKDNPQNDQPVRQQTYYIFHPLTQSFEPITIAEFEENAVIEEVVVAEDYSTPKYDIETSVVNEHDYIEITGDEGFQNKRQKLNHHDQSNLQTEMGDGVHDSQIIEFNEKVEIKPVIAPIVKEIDHSGIPKCNVVKIEKTHTEKFNQTSVIKRLTPELIEETVRNHKVIMDANASKVSEYIGGNTDEKSSVADLGKVIEETIGKENVRTADKVEISAAIPNSIEVYGDGVPQVDIEQLVDVCFKEELLKSTESDNSKLDVESYDTRIEHDIVATCKENGTKAIPKSRKLSGLKRRRQSGSLLPLKKRRTHLNSIVSLNSQKLMFFKFTIEEYLRLDDLVKRRFSYHEKLLLAFNRGIHTPGKSKEMASLLLLKECFDELNDEYAVLIRYISEIWSVSSAVELAMCKSVKETLPTPYTKAEKSDASKLFIVKTISGCLLPIIEVMSKEVIGNNEIATLLLLAAVTSVVDDRMKSLNRNYFLMLYRYLSSFFHVEEAAVTTDMYRGHLSKLSRYFFVCKIISF